MVSENNIDWKTAKAAKARAGGANPIGSYGNVARLWRASNLMRGI
jgi:hypothetical protein